MTAARSSTSSVLASASLGRPALHDAPSYDTAAAITRAIANELRGRDITVNAVVLERERPAIVAELVEAVAFLASEAGHGVNGQVIRFNGGLE